MYIFNIVLCFFHSPAYMQSHSSHSLHPYLNQKMSSQNSSNSPSLLLSAVTEFICIIHPLYFSYLIFFSPYILKLLSFLSPLLLLLLLCAFSASTSFLHGYKSEENAPTCVVEAEAYKIIFETFHDSATDSGDEVEAYKKMEKEALAPQIVKSCCSSTPLQDHPSEQCAEKSAICDEDELPPSPTSAEKSSDWDEAEIIKHMVCSSAVNTPEENEREDDEEKPVKPAVVGVGFDKAEKPLMTATTSQKSGSNAAIDESQQSPNSTDLHKTTLSKSRESWSAAGSMRREKEWRRTLACKLFEERHNKGGMDMLWETYEAVESPDDRSSRANARESDEFRVYVDEDDDEEEEEEGDDEERSGGKMCCLQALKMSSGKVNLGIGRKNMIRLSKALRGIGWLHKTSGSSKNVSRK